MKIYPYIPEQGQYSQKCWIASYKGLYCFGSSPFIALRNLLNNLK